VKPTYPLELVKGLIRDGSWYIAVTAQATALELGFDDEDVKDCILNHLADTHFYKTMESEKKPGLMQDVYRITYQEQRIYIKLQVNPSAVVISFKEE
jgi:hypothetical protein